MAGIVADSEVGGDIVWFRTAVNVEMMSVEGVEHSVTNGYVELPAGLQPGTVKYLVEHGYRLVPESEVPASLKGPKLPPVFEDAGYRLQE